MLKLIQDAPLMKSPPKANILIADDEPRICDSLKQLLDFKGYQVLTADTGKQAVDILSGNIIDLAVLDVKLAESEASLLLKYIKARQSSAPLVFISGSPDLDAVKHTLPDRTYEFILKPFNYESLLTRIEQMLEGKEDVQTVTVVRERKRDTGNMSGRNSAAPFPYASKQYASPPEEKLLDMIQNLPDIVYIVDTDGRFTFLNKAVEGYVGLKAEELIGQHFTSILVENESKRSRRSFNERRTGDRATNGRPLHLKCFTATDAGREEGPKAIRMELSSVGIYEKSGYNNSTFLGSYGVIKPMLSNKGEEAHPVDADIPHPPHSTAWDIFGEFNGIISQWLMLAKHHTNDLRRLNIDLIIKRSLDLLWPTVSSKIGVQYLSAPSPLHINGNSRQIIHALVNIFENAVHSMEKGGGQLTVSVSELFFSHMDFWGFDKKGPGAFVKISITDTGCGIDPHVMERMFDPYFTTKDMTRHKGVGLTLSKVIIQNYGGDLDVNSTPGEGTTVHIYLPLSD